MPPHRIHLVRHGQGQHNVEPLEKNRLIHDAREYSEGQNVRRHVSEIR